MRCILVRGSPGNEVHLGMVGHQGMRCILVWGSPGMRCILVRGSPGMRCISVRGSPGNEVHLGTGVTRE